MTSSPLFIRVAESTEIYLPPHLPFRVSTQASSGVTFANWRLSVQAKTVRRRRSKSTAHHARVAGIPGKDSPPAMH